MIYLGFLLAALAAVFQTALFPHISFFAFAPFLALVCMHAPFVRALWLSALAGLFFDCLSSDPFGIQAMNYVLCTALLYRFRNNFFKDQPLHLSFYTAFFSFCFIPLQLFLLFLFDRRAPIAGKWVIVDLLSMPIVDAIYAFFWFVGPLFCWEWARRQWKLWKLKQNVE